MYSWLWRHLPFGLAGKLTGSVLLAAAVVSLLWYVVFPWAEPLLPFDDVQVTQEGGVPGEPVTEEPGVGPEATPDPRESGLGDYDIPYATDEPAIPGD